MKIDSKYLIRMIDFHPEFLPRPTIKEFRCETLDELEIISVRCELNEV